ncbi:MAG: hypothetical protein CMI54_08560, partial [Parcubacteria group bacterium]|nr:hypothetical protein [Parcubacteria group bacterium]
TQFGKVVGNIGQSKPHKVKDMPSKCLVGVPERFSIAMRDNGWILRNTIIWHKPNCMPSSARDRFTVDFEPIFFFVKSKKYFFDMPREAPTDLIWAARMEKNVLKETGIKSPDKNVQRFGTTTNTRYNNPLGRAGRTVWRVTTQPFAEAHFATFPEELVKKPLLAGCPEFVCKACGKPREKIYEKSVPKLESRKALNHYLVSKKSSYEQGMSFKKGGFSEWRDKKLQEGLMNPDLVRDIFVGWSDCGCGVGWKAGVVLDPFMGSGTVGVVARKNSRDFIGFELNKEYVEIANKRLKPYMEQTKLTEVTDGY